MPKQPEDHQPKQDTDGSYTFRHNRKTYRLPPGEDAIPKIPGRFLRNAFMDGEQGEMALAFAMLENVDADPAALDALYEMPAPEMLNHLQAWMNHRADETAATLGESSSSLL